MLKLEKFIILLILISGILFPSYLVLSHNNNSDILHASVPENGNWSETEIKVQYNKIITLEIISDDVVHSFVLPSFNISVRLYPGELVEVTFLPNQIGNFLFYCDVVCSPKHAYMIGTIVVAR